MDHSFNVEVARIYGLPAAVFIQNLYFWILKNEANGRHYYEGRNWTYNSLSALASKIQDVTENAVEKKAKVEAKIRELGELASWL